MFDALLSGRPYKEPWPFERALAEIEVLAGSQFDPGLVQAFVSIAPELHAERFAAEEAAPYPLGAS